MMQVSITGNSEAVLLSASQGDSIIASSETMSPERCLAILAVTLGVDPETLQQEILETAI